MSSPSYEAPAQTVAQLNFNIHDYPLVLAPESRPTSPNKILQSSVSSTNTNSSTSYLCHELILSIFDFLINPHIYDPQTGQLHPSMAGVLSVLRPIFLTCKTFAQIARTLAVRHLVLDWDDTAIGIPSVKALISFIDRHQLGHAVRSLTLIPDRGPAPLASQSIALADDVFSLYGLLRALPKLDTLRIDFDQTNEFCRMIVATFFAAPFPFNRFLRSLIRLNLGNVRRSGSRVHLADHHIMFSLVKLFPSLKHIEGLGPSGENLLLQPAFDLPPSSPYEYKLQSIKLSLQQCTSMYKFLKINQHGLELLREHSLTLQSLTLTRTSSRFIGQNAQTTLSELSQESVFLHSFPHLLRLSLIGLPLDYATTYSLLLTCPALQILELQQFRIEEEDILQAFPTTLTELALGISLTSAASSTSFDPTSIATRIETLLARLVNLTLFDFGLLEKIHDTAVLSFTWKVFGLCRARSIRFESCACCWAALGGKIS